MASDPATRFNVQDVLDGKVAAPALGPNPFPLWSTYWYAWKEQHEDYVPYHIKCSTMPRVRVVCPGVFRCPGCGAEFPTATAKLEAEGLPSVDAILEEVDG